MKTTDKKNTTANIKWRHHEITLVTACLVMLAAGYFMNIHQTSMDQLATGFIANGAAFDLYKNVILPDVGLAISAFAVYLVINLYIVPRLIINLETGTSDKKKFSFYVTTFVQFAFLVFFLGTVFNFATYYKHQWQFNYPGFSLFFNKDNPRSQMDVTGTYFAASSVILLYGLYAGLREIAIHFLDKSKQKEYNILVVNRITGFLLQFICIPVFLAAFNIVHEPTFFVSYLLTVPAFFAMFINNVYWLFPKKGEAPFLSKRIIIPLLSTSFIYAVPLIVFVHEAGPIAFLYSWALQLFIVTPITWWYFQANKDKILQLRNVEKELVQSKADLQFLRSQINPHFLFNVLNTLYGTALQENAELTAGGIQKLGDMMRFMLHENNQDFIPMNREIEYLANYIELQKLRTHSSPDIIIEDNIAEQDCGHKIAPMLLIPLVENAFKHGISLKEKSWIKINLNCTAGRINFEVRNSVHAKTSGDPEKDKSGVGFKNVLERLKLVYPGRFKIDANEADGEYRVQLSIQPK